MPIPTMSKSSPRARERKEGKRDGTAELATGNEDKQHTLRSAQRKKKEHVVTDAESGQNLWSNGYSIMTMLSRTRSILFKTGSSATTLT